MSIDAREHELTAVLHRELFDQPPGDLDPALQPRWAAFRHAYHKASAELLAPQDFPLQVDFELNAHCNLRCSFCTHGHQTVKKKLLGFDRFQKAIDEGSRHGLASIKLNYINEPLLLPDLPAYIRYAKEKGVLNTYFATNGILLDESMARQLIQAGLSKIMVSLDAATRETFHLMRGQDKYDRILDNILGLLELRKEMGTPYPLLRVNFLRTENNSHEADAFIRFWTDRADMIGFQDMVALPSIDADFFALPSKRMQHFQCAFPFKLLVIDANGQILPCCTFSGRAMPLGHIDTMTLGEAWQTKKIADLRKVHQEGSYQDNPICKHCIANA